MQALAAVLGGTQSLHTNSMDEALGLPSAEAARTALRTQQILAHETGVADVADPLGGAPLVEALTDEIESRARALIDEIDAAGGALRALEDGLIQRWIESSAYRFQEEVESGRRCVIGVNRFAEYGDAPDAESESAGEGDRDERARTRVFRVDPRLEVERRKALGEKLAARDLASVTPSLEDVTSAARGGTNLMPPLIRAAEAGASLGEMMRAMASVFGEYQGAL